MAKQAPKTAAQNPFEAIFNFGEMPKMFDFKTVPTFDFSALAAAQNKNIAAMVEANRVTVDGYKAICDKQIALVEAAFADAKAELSTMKPETLTEGNATVQVEKMKALVEKTMADVKDLAEMAQKTNVNAMEILKARAEEVVSEVKTEVEKLAA